MKCPADKEIMKTIKITEMEFTNIVYSQCPRCGYKKTEYVRRMIPLSKVKKEKK